MSRLRNSGIALTGLMALIGTIAFINLKTSAWKSNKNGK